MTKRKNILFIMFDQLRHDYLSCGGHPHLHTPHMDSIAEKGVRFSRCYVQSPICGSSRMSFYTGRYASSHGAQWNGFPLKVGEQTIGDHLRKLGMSSWLVGKTHMAVDHEGMERLGITHDSIVGARVSECGFDIYARDDGLWAEGPDGFYDHRRSPYNEYLKSKGYEGENPWHDYANAGIDEEGNMASAWFTSHSSKPANIHEQDSETPWLTREVISFIESRKGNDEPWMCHASYIKPHWPYIVPAPYHDMYGGNQIQPVVRHPAEREDPHPVYEQFMNNAVGKAFSRDEVREAVMPAYMGLIKQCDDQMGVLFKYLEDTDQMKDTMIVLTSDHGDYLGDHWLGEKSLFHEQSAKVPMIIYDPSPEADAARGTVIDEPTEAIDLAATFVEFAGGKVPNHIIEGRSLIPFLRGEKPEEWRDYAISEFDYSATPMAVNLGLKPKDARLFMVTDKRWKFMHAEGQKDGVPFPPMLFDLENDPDELRDLGRSDQHDDILGLMYERLGKWGRRNAQRTTKSDDDIDNMRAKSRRKGIVLGVHTEDEVDPEITVKFRGPAKPLPANDG
ncbi:sulfatase-like hydrolase/transferase [Pseudahrensia aquimaris]|uniref:Sulfatase-like hydrolase/transferase n=1 Tax=Pseudahrensia aquimaris TaxID=744461 RepID=A0ABW3FFG5_9HYPH